MKVRHRADTYGVQYAVLDESPKYYIVAGYPSGDALVLPKTLFEPVPEWQDVTAEAGWHGNALIIKDGYHLRLVNAVVMAAEGTFTVLNPVTTQKVLLLERRS